MAGALSFSPILKIGPYPTPVPAWINAEPSRFGQPHRAVATPGELSASARVVILPAAGAAILGTSVLQYSGQGRSVEDNFGTAADAPIELLLLLPGVGRLVKGTSVFVYYPNHVQAPRS
jgi:hypothetical protein